MSQSFEKHAQYTPGYHFFTSPLGLIFVIWSIQRLIAQTKLPFETLLRTSNGGIGVSVERSRGKAIRSR